MKKLIALGAALVLTACTAQQLKPSVVGVSCSAGAVELSFGEGRNLRECTLSASWRLKPLPVKVVEVPADDGDSDE